MKNAWCVLFYETVDGKCPLQEFIDSRNKENQAKLLSVIDYLEKQGPNLPRPYADLYPQKILRKLLCLEQISLIGI